MSIEIFKAAILANFNAPAQWIESIPTREMFQGKLVWEGVVEVFSIHQGEKEIPVYAFLIHLDGSDAKAVTVLGLPPIDSPLTAVRAGIRTEIRKTQDQNRSN